MWRQFQYLRPVYARLLAAAGISQCEVGSLLCSLPADWVGRGNTLWTPDRGVLGRPYFENRARTG